MSQATEKVLLAVNLKKNKVQFKKSEAVWEENVCLLVVFKVGVRSDLQRFIAVVSCFVAAHCYFCARCGFV